jgi:phosphohistidine swiveling domain-containing protein
MTAGPKPKTTKMKTKKLTEEQIAKRDARREKFRALVRQVAQMPDAERMEIVNRAGAVITCEGRALSTRNTCLLFLQIPGVSVVGGFRQWLKAGRCVRKGEHGASIWIPLGRGKDAGEGETAADAGENESGEGSRFGVATVFDIAQTEELTETPVATVCPEIADAFGMRNLPNVRVPEELAVA